MIFLDIIYLNMLTGEYSSKLGLREGFLNLFFFFFFPHSQHVEVSGPVITPKLQR